MPLLKYFRKVDTKEEEKPKKNEEIRSTQAEKFVPQRHLRQRHVHLVLLTTPIVEILYSRKLTFVELKETRRNFVWLKISTFTVVTSQYCQIHITLIVVSL